MRKVTSRSPGIGDTFAVPLTAGRYGAVRVLARSEEEGTSLVAVTSWLRDRVPDVADPALREILREHRGFFDGSPAICWFSGSPPEEFVHVGVLPPTEDELALDPQGCFGGDWHASMAMAVLLERGEPASDLED